MWETDRSRGVTPTLTYVLSIGIVTVLVAGLLVSTTTFVEGEQSSVVREELGIVGDRIAADVSAVDRASRRGARVTQLTSVPVTVADTPYNIDVVGCQAGRACLALTSADPAIDVNVTVPLDNRSAVDVTASEPRTVRIVATPHGSVSPAADDDVSVNPNIGIADGISRGGGLSGAGFSADTAPVVSGFSYSPTRPSVGESIRFESDVTTVVDGNYTYRWDFDDDGTPEAVGNESTAANATYTYSSPDRYPVTLTVVGPNNDTASATRLLRPSGLLLVPGSSTDIDKDNDGPAAGVSFELENNFPSQELTITDVEVDPENPAMSRLYSPGDFSSGDAEVAIDGTRSYEAEDDPSTSDYITVFPDGTILNLQSSTDVNSGDAVEFRIGEFHDGGTGVSDQVATDGETFSISVRYETSPENNYVSTFNVTPGSTGTGPGLPPTIDSLSEGTDYECDGTKFDDDPVTVTVSDPNNDLDSVEVRLVGGGPPDTTTKSFAAGGDTKSFDISQEDRTKVEITATDAAGNSKTRQVTC